MKQNTLQEEERILKEGAFWNAFAPKYDRFIQRNANQAYDIILKMLAEDIGTVEKLLEIATGTGTVSLALCSRAHHVNAIDISTAMVAAAKEKAAAASIANIDFQVGDSCNLDFEDNHFDVVIASNVLHLLFFPERALQEARRVLRKSGKLIVPSYLHGENLRSHFISRILALGGFKANHRWSAQSFASFVEEMGFSIQKQHLIKGKIPLLYLVAIR